MKEADTTMEVIQMLLIPYISPLHLTIQAPSFAATNNPTPIQVSPHTTCQRKRYKCCLCCLWFCSPPFVDWDRYRRGSRGICPDLHLYCLRVCFLITTGQYNSLSSWTDLLDNGVLGASTPSSPLREFSNFKDCPTLTKISFRLSSFLLKCK